MPDGCSGEPDREFLTFLRYVWNFDRDSRPGIEKTRPAVGPEVPTVQLQNLHHQLSAARQTEILCGARRSDEQRRSLALGGGGCRYRPREPRGAGWA